MTFPIGRARLPAVRPITPGDRVVDFATAELRRYLGDILGARLPGSGSPAIVVGVSPASRNDREAYTIRVAPHGITIMGGGPAGTLYGVYEFLRRYAGCRFSNPAPDGEFVPRRSGLVIPCGELSRTPLTAVRGMQIARKHDPAAIQRQVDWMAKIGLNTVMTLPRVDDDPSVAVDVDPATGEARTSGGRGRYTDAWFRDNVLPSLQDRGMQVCMANHNFRRWVPPHKHFREHPDWYALVDGRRSPWVGQMCLCTTNRDMIATMIENIRRYLREHREVRIVGVCPEDGYGCCQCDRCRALDNDPDDAFRERQRNFRSPRGENPGLSRRYALLVNEVARALRKEFPDVLVYYAAYVDLQWPPRDVALEDNVAVMLALYWRCGAHLIAEDACEMNRFFHDLIRQWQDAHRGPLFVNDYYLGMSAQRSLPYPMAPVICANWPVYRARGVTGAKTNTESTHLAVYGPNFLAYARCGWEEHVEPDAVRREFLEGMFGAAAPAMEPVYNALDAAVEGIGRGEARASRYLKAIPPAKGCLLPNGRNIGYFLDRLGDTRLEQALTQARSLATTARETRQVRHFEEALTYWKAYRDYVDARLDAERAEADAGVAAAAPHYRRALTALRTVQDATVRPSESGWSSVTPDTFAKEADILTRKASDRA